jgi:tetratricopeptide (TPR) repeat protein
LHYAPGHGGARVELASIEVHAGFERLTASDVQGAIEHLEAALALDPRSMEAHHFLGQAYFDDGDAQRAAQEWQWVVDTARLDKLELPEPVHLKLAQAQALDGDFEASRATLDAYLRFEPTGAYVDLTRLVLAKLPAASADVAPADHADDVDE